MQAQCGRTPRWTHVKARYLRRRKSGWMEPGLIVVIVQLDQKLSCLQLLEQAGCECLRVCYVIHRWKGITACIHEFALKDCMENLKVRFFMCHQSFSAGNAHSPA